MVGGGGECCWRVVVLGGGDPHLHYGSERFIGRGCPSLAEVIEDTEHFFQFEVCLKEILVHNKATVLWWWVFRLPPLPPAFSKTWIKIKTQKKYKRGSKSTYIDTSIWKSEPFLFLPPSPSPWPQKLRETQNYKITAYIFIYQYRCLEFGPKSDGKLIIKGPRPYWWLKFRLFALISQTLKQHWMVSNIIPWFQALSEL